MFHIGHGGAALVHMDVADVHAPAAQSLQHGRAPAVRANGAHIGDVSPQPPGVDGHIHRVAAEMILARLAVMVYTVISHTSDPFHSSALVLSMAHLA